jgi:arsenate reductase-like glutaredoxin family protein
MTKSIKPKKTSKIIHKKKIEPQKRQVSKEDPMKEEVLGVLSYLRMMLSDLPDTVQYELKELIEDLREDIQDSKITKKKVNWKSYAESINDICVRDGMPKLCDVKGK